MFDIGKNTLIAIGFIVVGMNEYEILIKQTNPNYRDIIKELDELKAALREKGILP